MHFISEHEFTFCVGGLFLSMQLLYEQSIYLEKELYMDYARSISRCNANSGCVVNSNKERVRAILRYSTEKIYLLLISFRS